MSSPVEERLRDFTRRLITRLEGLVEWPATDEEGVAILPSEVAGELGVDDEVRLTTEVKEGALSVNLATDFLERVDPLVRSQPAVALFRLPPLYLKKGDMVGAVDRAFQWHNAKVVVVDTLPLLVEYHEWTMVASLRSEDTWEDVFSLTVNSHTGATVALPDLMTLRELEPNPKPQPHVASTYRAALVQGMREMERRSLAFTERLQARLERDRKRLHDYYSALLQENGTRRRRAPAPDDEEKREAKRRAVNLELKRKLVELEERYAIRAEVAPVALLRCQATVLGVRCQVFRKQAQRMHTLIWNPLLKEMEPLACSACGTSTYSVVFSNKDVSPLCPLCG